MTAKGVRRQVAYGVVSGLAGTLAMTAVQTLDAKRTGREPSQTPAKAIEKISGIQLRSEAAEAKLTTATHWTYGTSWGVVRSLIGALVPNPVAATAAHFLVVWTGGMANLTALGLAPPPTRWGKQTLAKDAMYHAVYAAAAGLTYEWLARRAVR